jgi:hypothetical protein
MGRSLDTFEGWHAVQFYREDGEINDAVVHLARDALERGEAVLHVATSARAAAVRERLLKAGLDAGALEAEGRLVILDAEQQLERLLKDGRPDREAFQREIGGLVRRLLETGRPLHVFGEMVDVLWQRGEAEEMLRLEEFWNELLQAETFTLHCGVRLTGTERDARVLPHNLDRHSHLLTALTKESKSATAVVVTLVDANPRLAREMVQRVRDL